MGKHSSGGTRRAGKDDPVAVSAPASTQAHTPAPARTTTQAPAPRTPLAERVPAAQPSGWLAAPAPVTVPAREPDLPPVPAFRPDERSTTPGPGVVTPSRAAQKERERVRRTRRRLSVAVAAVAGLALLGGAVAALWPDSAGGTSGSGRVAPPARSQRTVLMAIDDPTGDETALLASDPVAGTSSVLLLPSRTVTPVAGGGQLPLGQAAALPELDKVSGSVSDLLGLTVDVTWRVTPAALAQLIDSLGGMTLNVDTQIISGDTVVLQPGPQHVGGAAAVAFAQYLAANEDESARLARLQQVVAGLLTAAAAQKDHVGAAVGALGAGSEITMPTPALTKLLLQTQNEKNDGTSVGPAFSLLPVTTIDTGGTTPAYRVDAAALTNYIMANLAASVPPGARAGGLRIFVYNGTLEYGVGAAARKQLVAAGLSFVGSGNVASINTGPSVVLVPDGTQQSRTRGMKVAAALGLPAEDVQVSEVSQDVADVIVITGSDYKFS